MRVEGKSFAIVDQKPVASGTDAKNVYEEAKTKLPTQTHWFWVGYDSLQILERTENGRWY